MNMPSYIDSLIHTLAEALPGVFGAIAILVIGWFIALIFKRIVYRIMLKTDWDERLLGNTIVDTNKFLASLVYYIIMLVVLLVVLEMLGVSYVLDPIKNMLDEFLGFIPNILAALAIAFIGYIIAKFVSNLVKMAGSVIDRLAKNIGFKETDKLISFIQQIVFIAIFIPLLIQALNALHLEAITQPANNLLHRLLDAVPNIIGAILIITIFALGGKFLTAFLKDLMINLGTDKAADRLQISTMIGEGQSLSNIIGNVIYFFLVFFGVVSGVEMLGFERITHSLHNILNLSGNILFGLVIMVIGNFISGIVHNSLSKNKDNLYIAGIARMAIIGLFLAISLRTMGIANSIVDLAFGLILGALAVTVALSYGLGGREAAGKHMAHILKKFQGGKEKD